MSYHQFTSDERKCLWELHRKTSAFERLLMRWEELLPLFLVNCGGIAVRKERGILSLPTKGEGTAQTSPQLFSPD